MIKDLPTLDKPREKAIMLGVNNLTDAELVAILLRTGTKNISVLDIAHKIVNSIENISNDKSLTIESLSKTKGVGKAKAITLLSAIELGKRSLKNNNIHFKAINSKVVYDNLKYYIYKEKQELLFILFLDKNKNVIKIKKLYQGTNDLINIKPNDIFKEALIHSCSYIILAHNHPSGSSFPSESDIKATKKILESGKLLNINLIDHIILTDNDYYSFYENGDLK